MRLSEPIETSGRFWLLEEPGDWLPGLLKISESGEIRVELSGIFGDPFDALDSVAVALDSPTEEPPSRPKRMVGILERGGKITLDGCRWVSRKVGLVGGMSKSIVHAELAYIGRAYDKQEEVVFSRLSFAVEGLDNWLLESGITVARDIDNKSGSIGYKVPDDVALPLSDSVKVGFTFNLTSPAVSFPVTEVTIKQTASVFVQSREPRPIKYFSSFTFKLCNLLSLALNDRLTIQSMTGQVAQDHKDDQIELPISIYGQFAPWTENIPQLRWHRALFRYPDVAGHLNHIVVKWFENYENYEPAFNLYFASITQTSQFLDTKVLWLAQALEILHRRTSDEREMPEQEFSDLSQSVMQTCAPERRDWLGARLRYANELSLRRRLNKLIKPFEHLLGDRRERRFLVNTICDTRNYLTHFDEKTTKDRARDPRELFDLYRKMAGLFELHLLRLTGFDEGSIDRIIRNNSDLKGRLGLQLTRNSVEQEQLFP